MELKPGCCLLIGFTYEVCRPAANYSRCFLQGIGAVISRYCARFPTVLSVHRQKRPLPRAHVCNGLANGTCLLCNLKLLRLLPRLLKLVACTSSTALTHRLMSCLSP